METIVNIVLVIAGIYLVMGVVFATAFVLKGITIVDEGVKGATIGFRVIILPGVIIFWPLLFKKWMKASKSKQSDNDKTAA